MKNGIAWSEDEARAAVSAYFKILLAEQDGVDVNKAELYRALFSAKRTLTERIYYPSRRGSDLQAVATTPKRVHAFLALHYHPFEFQRFELFQRVVRRCR